MNKISFQKGLTTLIAPVAQPFTRGQIPCFIARLLMMRADFQQIPLLRTLSLEHA